MLSNYKCKNIIGWRVISILILIQWLCAQDNPNNPELQKFLDNIQKTLQQLHKRGKKKATSKNRKEIESIKKKNRKQLINSLANPYIKLPLNHSKYIIQTSRFSSSSLQRDEMITSEQQRTPILSKSVKHFVKETSPFTPNSLKDIYSIISAKKNDFPFREGEGPPQVTNTSNSSTRIDNNDTSYISELKEWYLRVITRILDFWDIIDNGIEILLTKCLREERNETNVFCMFQPGFRPPDREICRTGSVKEEADRHTLLTFHKYINIFSPLSVGENGTYSISKRVRFNCNTFDHLNRITRQESLCFNLSTLDKKYKCKREGLLNTLAEKIFECIRNYSFNPNRSSEKCRNIEKIVKKFYLLVYEYFTDINKIYLYNVLPQIIEKCYVECDLNCEYIGVGCAKDEEPHSTPNPFPTDLSTDLSPQELLMLIIIYYLDNNQKLIEKVKIKGGAINNWVRYSNYVKENIDCGEKSLINDIISKELEKINIQKGNSVIQELEKIKDEIDKIKKLCKESKYKECFERYNKLIQSNAKEVVENANILYAQYSETIFILRDKIEKFIKEPTSNPLCRYFIFKQLESFTLIERDFLKIINESNEEIKTQYLEPWVYEIILKRYPEWQYMETIYKNINNTVPDGVYVLESFFNNNTTIEFMPLFDYHLYFLKINAALKQCLKKREDSAYLKCLLEQRNPLKCVDKEKYKYVFTVLDEFSEKYLNDKLTISNMEEMINRISNLSSLQWLAILPETYKMCITTMDKNCCPTNVVGGCPLEKTFTESDINNFCPGPLKDCNSLEADADKFCYREQLQQSPTTPPPPQGECNPDEDLGCDGGQSPPPQQSTKKIVKCRKILNSQCPRLLEILQRLLGVSSIVLQDDLNENNFCTQAKIKLKDIFNPQSIIELYTKRFFWTSSPTVGNIRDIRENFQRRLKIRIGEKYWDILKSKISEDPRPECR